MFFKKKVDAPQNEEDRICALCEFSVIREGQLLCRGKKAVEDTHFCRKYIFDPNKKRSRRQLFSTKGDDIEFPPLD